MPQTHPLSSDAGNNFEDLSGINSSAFSNPYDALIEACGNDPVSSTSPLFANLLPTKYQWFKEKGMSLSASSCSMYKARIR
jgi:hypothetical protein